MVDKSVFTIDTLWSSWYSKSTVDHTEVIVAYMGPAETMQTSLSPFNTAYDNDYDWSSCFSCNLRHSHEHSVVLKLTGQCSKSVFETYYHLQLDDEGYVMFHGFTGTVIRYDGDTKRWKMSVIQVPGVTATSKADFETLILGNHEWEIENDVDCFDGKEKKVLTMSSCNTNQYTCDDGLCVNLDYRCDGKPHCKDKSDELECRLIEEDKSYQKFLTPPPIKDDKKLVMNMIVDIVAIGDIKEIESTIDFQFTLTLNWFESRLKFANLIANASNTLTPAEIDYLWIPKLIFFNTEDRLKTVLDEWTIIGIKREGPYQSLQNKRTYKGGENTMSSSRFYNTEFVCIFNMKWYPFDTQKCSMVFVVDEQSKDFVDMQIEKLNFLGPKELTQYFVKKNTARKAQISGRKSITVEIVLGRRLLSLILTIFAPTIILNLVGHLSNFFKEFFFEATISVNVTVMLVLTTMFISVSSNLPKTSYIKMIDVWLLTSLVKPFLDILLQTYIDHLRLDEKREINHHGKPREVGGDEPEDKKQVKYNHSQ